MKKTPANAAKASARSGKRAASPTGAGTTTSGPSNPAAESATELAAHAADQQAMAEAMPFNASKAAEYGQRNAENPVEGASTEPPSPTAGAGTLSERNKSPKTGKAPREPVAVGGDLGRVRVNDTGQTLTTNQGVPVADNQNSLKAGLRGPTLLEDFILREKITHFDHERIPERIVHARGSGAHGYFRGLQAADQTHLRRAIRRCRQNHSRYSCASRQSRASVVQWTRRAMCVASR